MAKIRGIKPDYWTDEDIVELSIPARLMFIGLWSYACDNGHLEDKPKQLKMRLFPGDDVSAADLLRELAKANRIVRDGGWVTIPNFTKHQRPDKRYFQHCDAPGCRPEADPQPKTRRAPHEPTTSTPRGLDVVSMGTPGDGDGDGDGELMVKDAPDKSVAKRATSLPPSFEPTEKHKVLADSLGVSLARELPKFRDHHRAKGSKMKDWNAALNNWLRRSAEYGGKVIPLQAAVDEQGRTVLPPLPSTSFWDH